MPRRPQRQKRPADVIGNAVKVMRIAIGEEEEKYEDDGKDPAARTLGAKGGRARAAKFTPEQGSKIAPKPGPRDPYNEVQPRLRHYRRACCSTLICPPNGLSSGARA